MPLFNYKTIGKNGRRAEGVVDAVTITQAQEILEDKGLEVISLEASEKESAFEFRISFLERVSAKDLVIFSRKLSMMISSDMSLVQSLKIIEQQTDTPKLRDALGDIADDVDGGTKFSEALEVHRNIFGNFYISMVRNGETTGRLDDVLTYLADQQEKDYDMSSKIKGAMTYPAFIMAAMVIVTYLMMTFILPKLTAVLTESNLELPLPTKILIAVSNFSAEFWWLILIVLIGLVVGIPFLIKKTRMGKRVFDIVMSYAPVFGKQLTRKIYIVRLTRSLSTLLKGGVALPEALKITSEVVTNSLYREILSATVEEVEDGNPMASVFSRYSLMPSMVSRLILIGEETGNLEDVLSRLSKFYERELDNTVQNLTTLLEPLILVVMGIGVGLLVVAIMLPMFKLAQAF